jgi:hypothetical protein
VMSVAGNILQRSLEKGENLKHCHTVWQFLRWA